jgi:hypothetical protein
MGIEPPTTCQIPPLELVLALAENGDCPAPSSTQALRGTVPCFPAAPGSVDRVLVYAPDAIGRVFLDGRPELKKRLVAASDVQVELRSMIPPKTPVCYASMFTGALPEVHGIRKYERPVLTCDTLFDALARRDTQGHDRNRGDCTGLRRAARSRGGEATRRGLSPSDDFGSCPECARDSDRVPNRTGRRVAIVAVKDCSMDIIFRNRPIDYFTEGDDQQVTGRALELVRDDKHDFIVAYNQEYDDTLHRTRHDGPEALAAARRHVETFERLSQATEEHWAGYSRALLFAPDHGAHFDATKGMGDHGDDIPEDMDVLHFWRVRPAAPAVGIERAPSPV